MRMFMHYYYSCIQFDLDTLCLVIIDRPYTTAEQISEHGSLLRNQILSGTYIEYVCIRSMCHDKVWRGRSLGGFLIMDCMIGLDWSGRREKYRFQNDVLKFSSEAN